jgi:hypothetical protein
MGIETGAVLDISLARHRFGGAIPKGELAVLILK